MRRDARGRAAVAPPTGAGLLDGRSRQLPALPSRSPGRGRGAGPRDPDQRGADAGHQRRARDPGAVVRGVDRLHRDQWRPDAADGRIRPIGSPSSTAAAVAPTASPPVAATPRASVTVSPPPASPTLPPSAPSSTPLATPLATPKPVVTPKPKPSSSRYALLKPCPSKPDCWIYTIRSGDNLFSIANYFGVPLERVRALNPWTRTERLRAGRQLILPPPTR